MSNNKSKFGKVDEGKIVLKQNKNKDRGSEDLDKKRVLTERILITFKSIDIWVYYTDFLLKFNTLKQSVENLNSCLWRKVSSISVLFRFLKEKKVYMFNSLCSLIFKVPSLKCLAYDDVSPDWLWQAHYCHVTRYVLQRVD